MSKRTAMPKEFGHGVTGSLFAGAQAESNDLFSFVIGLCEEARKKGKDEVLKEVQERFKNKILENITNPALRKETEGLWFDIADAYSKILLTIGFAFGQRVDIVSPEAQIEIDYVWKRAKEERLFPFYPKGRRTQ